MTRRRELKRKGTPIIHIRPVRTPGHVIGLYAASRTPGSIQYWQRGWDTMLRVIRLAWIDSVRDSARASRVLP